MRYLLRNAMRDLSLESLRRAHPGRCLLRPMIDGKPLPAGSVRYLNLADFTEKLLLEIEDLVRIGNVQLIAAGRLGSSVDLNEIRRLRGWKIPAAVVVVEETPADQPMVSEAVVPAEPPETAAVVEDVEPLVPETTEQMPVSTEHDTPSGLTMVLALYDHFVATSADVAVEPPLPEDVPVATTLDVVEAPMPAPDVVEKTPPQPIPSVSGGTESLLTYALVDLRERLVKLGGKAYGKNKEALVREILRIEGERNGQGA